MAQAECKKLGDDWGHWVQGVSRLQVSNVRQLYCLYTLFYKLRTTICRSSHVLIDSRALESRHTARWTDVTLQFYGGCLTVLGFCLIAAALCSLVYMTVEGNVIRSAATQVPSKHEFTLVLNVAVDRQAWYSSMALPHMAMVVPEDWSFELLGCSIKNGNLSTATCTNRTTESEECSVSQLYNQPNLAVIEAGGTTHCLPGMTNASDVMHIQGRFGDEDYRFAQVTNIYILILN